MDGGSSAVLSAPRTKKRAPVALLSSLRVRSRAGAAVPLLDSAHEWPRTPTDRVLVPEMYLERVTVDNARWLVLVGTKVGLPIEAASRRSLDLVLNWRHQWDEDFIEIERLIAGEWVSVENAKDWEEL